MAHYVYLISSLPMLHFGAKAPFSFEKFLVMCEDLIPEKDLAVLQTLPKPHTRNDKSTTQKMAKQWVAFDTALRNELVKVRASRKHIEPARYLRETGYWDSFIAQVALSAQRNPSVLEAERFLDRERWNVLDELAFGHYFDLDFLIIYAYKLLILERWDKIRLADKTAVLEKVLQNT